VKVGDLVKRKLYGYLAVVLERDNHQRYGDYVKVAYVDNGEIDSGSASKFEVISKAKGKL